MSASMVDILIVDASLVVRTLARSFVERALPTTVRAREASTLEEAREAVRASGPDVVLLDPALPDGRGIDLFPGVAAANPGAKIVLMTSLPRSDPVVLQAIGAGALAYVPKPLRYHDVCDAFRDCEVPLAHRVPIASPGLDRPVFRGIPPR